MQLPLAIDFPETATFDNYLSGPNVLLLDVLKKMTCNGGESQLYLWSEGGLGKTHLLQASCRASSATGNKSCYLPFSVMRRHGTQILQGLEKLDFIAIDDLDRIVADIGWQRAIFSLINDCRNNSVPLLFAARTNIAELQLQLPDLRSRLAWGPVFELRELDDHDKKNVLQERARQRSLELNDEAVNYVLSRYPRDMRHLFELLDRLDRASLSAQRRLTVPFIKSVLESG